MRASACAVAGRGAIKRRVPADTRRSASSTGDADRRGSVDLRASNDRGQLIGTSLKRTAWLSTSKDNFMGQRANLMIGLFVPETICGMMSIRP
jgi:hypothetical protein